MLASLMWPRVSESVLAHAYVNLAIFIKAQTVLLILVILLLYIEIASEGTWLCTWSSKYIAIDEIKRMSLYAKHTEISIPD